MVGVVKGGNTSVDTQTGVNTAILGQYGTLTLQADGSYTYKANADAITSNVQDIFTYTVKDADGDLKSTTLTIDVANVTGTPTPTTGGQVSESGLEANAATGTFDGTATGTGTNVLTGQALNLAAGWTAQAQTGNGTYGTFTVNANGTYSYTLTQRTEDGAGVATTASAIRPRMPLATP